MEHPDDAAVVRVRDDLALVQTVDVITAIADDPFTFGRIAATNAISDVYAMGGVPLSALAIVGFPVGAEPPATYRRILEGAMAALADAGAVLVGGHSLDDPELKFGLAVTGTVDPRQVLTKGGAAPGDVLVLTKPLGTGLVSTAHRRGEASAAIVDAALASMCALNRDAAAAARAAGARCATDVTGFGLLGHLREVVAASGVDVELRVADVPLLPGAADFAARGLSPGGTARNLDFVRPWVDGLDAVSPADAAILGDPQTSGGLLIAVPAAGFAAFQAALAGTPVAVATIGRCVAGSGPGKGRIRLVPRT